MVMGNDTTNCAIKTKRKKIVAIDVNLTEQVA